jgi:outer membrane protein OmpA-like peptidoglycan-associated protein
MIMKHLLTVLLLVLIRCGCFAQYADAVLVSGRFLKLDIKYELNKAVLRSGSIELLCELADQLKKYPDLRFKIAVHTDSRASTNSCTRITTARAMAVTDCLIKNYGVSPQQVIAYGYGETKPARLDDGTVLTEKYSYSKSDKAEQERLFALNRRTEIQCIVSVQ